MKNNIHDEFDDYDKEFSASVLLAEEISDKLSKIVKPYFNGGEHLAVIMAIAAMAKHIETISRDAPAVRKVFNQLRDGVKFEQKGTIQ